MNIEVRSAKPEDAEGILKAHYSAVRNTAFRDYSLEVLSEWSPQVTPARISKYLRDSLPNESTLVATVDGQVAGFGAIVEAIDELRAVYVNAEFGRQGVGSALLTALESLARERGCRELKMDSSLMAAPFYRRHGYAELERSVHQLSSGRRMECVRMRKAI